MRITATGTQGETVWFDRERARSIRQVTVKTEAGEELRTVITFDGSEALTVMEAPSQLLPVAVAPPAESS
jgi:hypothetical protein